MLFFPLPRKTAMPVVLRDQVGPNADLVKVTPKKLEITPGETEDRCCCFMVYCQH